jgi:hypothetical protein
LTAKEDAMKDYAGKYIEPNDGLGKGGIGCAWLFALMGALAMIAKAVIA